MLRWKMNPALENRSTVDQLMITDAEKQWSFIASCRKKLFLQKIVWAYMKNVCLRDSINVAVKKVYFATVKILKIFCWFLKIRFAALEHWNEDLNSSILIFQAFLSSKTLYFFCLTVTLSEGPSLRKYDFILIFYWRHHIHEFNKLVTTKDYPYQIWNIHY